jgi:hypothetical protein
VWLGLLAERTGDADPERHYLDALEVARQAGVLHPVGEATGRLAALAWKRGDHQRARLLVDRAVDANRQVADGWQLLAQLALRAELCVVDEDLTQAALDIAEASALALRIDAEWDIAEVVATGARLLHALGDDQTARTAIHALQAWAAPRSLPDTPAFPIQAALAQLRPIYPLEPGLDAPSIRAAVKAVHETLSA